jgi:membrane associated rhomboid family serine protease
VIPLRDDVPSRSVPLVNYGLIALNAIFFLAELGMGANLERFFHKAAVIPALYLGDDGRFTPVDILASSFDADLGSRVLIAMFLHGGWAHFLGNMLYLWIFGDNVEDRMGHFRYLIFYVLCGWTASYAHIWSDPASGIPSIGASGAIAGVLGAYLALYPQARVVTLLPLGFLLQVVRIPAFFFLGFWFLQQFLSGSLTMATAGQQTGGVAWWAHIGGFVAGLALVWLFQSRKRRPPKRDAWWEEDPRYRRYRVRGW